jgi:DNA-binding protein HU-beta
MNKAELVSVASEKVGLTKKDTELVLNAAIETIIETLAAGEKVQLVGFGAFEVKHRAARLGRNPKTKESIEIPPAQVPVFKPGKMMKEAICKETK